MPKGADRKRHGPTIRRISRDFGPANILRPGGIVNRMLSNS
jgi:hypothetical protein